MAETYATKVEVANAPSDAPLVPEQASETKATNMNGAAEPKPTEVDMAGTLRSAATAPEKSALDLVVVDAEDPLPATPLPATAPQESAPKADESIAASAPEAKTEQAADVAPADKDAGTTEAKAKESISSEGKDKAAETKENNSEKKDDEKKASETTEKKGGRTSTGSKTEGKKTVSWSNDDVKEAKKSIAEGGKDGEKNKDKDKDKDKDKGEKDKGDDQNRPPPPEAKVENFITDLLWAPDDQKPSWFQRKQLDLAAKTARKRKPGAEIEINKKKKLFPIPIESQEALEKEMLKYNVNKELYGQGSAKTVEQLWKELEKKECSLHSNGILVRRTNPLFVRVVIQKKNAEAAGGPNEDEEEDYVLVETHRKKGDKIVPRNMMLAARRKPGESIWDTACKCVKKELFMKPNCIQMREGLTVFEEVKVSNSYPEMVCVYRTTIVTLDVDLVWQQAHGAYMGLPMGDNFNTERDDDGKRIVSYWAWWDAATFADSGGQGALFASIAQKKPKSRWRRTLTKIGESVGLVGGDAMVAKDPVSVRIKRKLKQCFAGFLTMYGRYETHLDFILDTLVITNTHGEGFIHYGVIACVALPWILLFGIHTARISYRNNRQRRAAGTHNPLLCFCYTMQALGEAIPAALCYEILVLTKYLVKDPIDYAIYAHMRLRTCTECLFEAAPSSILQLIWITTSMLDDGGDFKIDGSFIIVCISTTVSVSQVIGQCKVIHQGAMMQTNGSYIKYLQALMSLSDTTDLAPFGLMSSIKANHEQIWVQMKGLSTGAWDQLTSALAESNVKSFRVEEALLPNMADRQGCVIFSNLGKEDAVPKLKFLTFPQNFAQPPKEEQLVVDDGFGAAPSDALGTSGGNSPASSISTSQAKQKLAVSQDSYMRRQSAASSTSSHQATSSHWTQSAVNAEFFGDSRRAHSRCLQTANMLGCFLAYHKTQLEYLDWSWNCLGVDGARSMLAGFRITLDKIAIAEVTGIGKKEEGDGDQASLLQLNSSPAVAGGGSAAEVGRNKRSRSLFNETTAGLSMAVGKRSMLGVGKRVSMFVSSKTKRKTVGSLGSGEPEEEVKSLDLLLTGNSMKDTGILSLVKIMHSAGWKDRLRILRLDANCIRNGGASAIMGLAMPLLEELSLRKNWLGQGASIGLGAGNRGEKKRERANPGGFAAIPSEKMLEEPRLPSQEHVIDFHQDEEKNGTGGLANSNLLSSNSASGSTKKKDFSRSATEDIKSINDVQVPMTTKIQSERPAPKAFLKEKNHHDHGHGHLKIPDGRASLHSTFSKASHSSNASHLSCMSKSEHTLAEMDAGLVFGEALKTVQRLDLSDNFLTADVLENLSRDCGVNKCFEKLKILDISRCVFLGDEGVKFICDALCQVNAETLQHLALAEVNMSTHGLKNCAFERFKKIETMVLNGNNIDSEAASVMFTISLKTSLMYVALAKCPQLEKDPDMALATFTSILRRKQWRLVDLEQCFSAEICSEKVTQLITPDVVGATYLRMPPWFKGPAYDELPTPQELPLLHYFVDHAIQQANKDSWEELLSETNIEKPPEPNKGKRASVLRRLSQQIGLSESGRGSQGLGGGLFSNSRRGSRRPSVAQVMHEPGRRASIMGGGARRGSVVGWQGESPPNAFSGFGKKSPVSSTEPRVNSDETLPRIAESKRVSALQNHDGATGSLQLDMRKIKSTNSQKDVTKQRSNGARLSVAARNSIIQSAGIAPLEDPESPSKVVKSKSKG